MRVALRPFLHVISGGDGRVVFTLAPLALSPPLKTPTPLGLNSRSGQLSRHSLGLYMRIFFRFSISIVLKGVTFFFSRDSAKNYLADVLRITDQKRILTILAI